MFRSDLFIRPLESHRREDGHSEKHSLHGVLIGEAVVF